MTAALSIYLYGVLAVVVLDGAGHDPSDGWTPAQGPRLLTLVAEP